MQNVPPGEQIVPHKLKSAHHVKGGKRKGEGEDRGGGGGGETEAKKQTEEETDYVKGQNVMSLIDYSICHEKKQDKIEPTLSIHRE